MDRLIAATSNLPQNAKQEEADSQGTLEGMEARGLGTCSAGRKSVWAKRPVSVGRHRCRKTIVEQAPTKARPT